MRDPAGFAARIDQYVQWARMKGYSEKTLDRAVYHFRRFAAWCEERGIVRPSDVTRPILERFQRHIFYHINPATDRPMGLASQHALLTTLRSFFKWMTRQHLILYNPTADIDIPRRDQRLPRHVLTVEDAERVLSQPNIRTVRGLRDRAILETLYSTGLRRMEIRNLKIDDVQLEHGTVFVRRGKGGKDRVVPIGERACAWIRRYLNESRPKLVYPPDDRTIFLSMVGKPIREDKLTDLAGRYLKSSGVEKGGGCHLFRHTCATLMLEGGADIRYIQALLGHALLSTTQIYTHVAIKKLKEVHTFSHPAARLKSDNRSD